MSDIPADLDIRLKLSQIDRELAQHDQLRADHDRKRQEIRLAPWQLAIGGVGTGAALFAAAVALTKLMLTP